MIQPILREEMAGMSEFLGGEAGVPHGRLTFLRWSRQTVDGAVVVRLAGELDLSTAAAFRRILSIAQSDTAATIVLDMSDVCFIDAHSVGLIVGASTAAEGRGRVLRVDGLHGLPARVFRLMGLEPMLVRRSGDTAERQAGG